MEVWRYPIREYQQRHPSLKHGAAGNTDERELNKDQPSPS
jgi:hypothetical protein